MDRTLEPKVRNFLLSIRESVEQLTPKQRIDHFELVEMGYCRRCGDKSGKGHRCVNTSDVNDSDPTPQGAD